MLIDIHTHVQQFNNEDIEILINNSIKNKIKIIIAAGTTLSDSKSSVALSKKYKEIYSAVGIHPQNIFDENTDNYIEKLSKLTEDDKTIMISEIGLDFQENSPDKKIQQDFFYEQINLAKRKKLPVAFHVRNAEKDAISLLSISKINEIKSVAHYFSGDYDYAKKLLDKNVYISVAKPFLRDEILSEVIKKIPLEQIVIETDSYPQYFKKNRLRWTEPKDLVLIVEKLSNLKKIKPELLIEKIESNSKYILNL
jgi:TatD DNase family protein